MKLMVRDFKVCSYAIRNCRVLSNPDFTDGGVKSYQILVSGDGDCASVWSLTFTPDQPEKCSELISVGGQMKHEATVRYYK